MVEVEGFRAGLECGQGLADRGIIQRRQPEPLDRAAKTTVFHQLAGDHLAFAVGVGGNNQFFGFTQQTLDRLELASSFRLDLHLPALGNDRQIAQHPALVAGVIGIRRGGFQQMADAPSHGHSKAEPAAIATSIGAEHLGDVLGLGGFFAEKQPHRRHLSIVRNGHSMRSGAALGNLYLYECTVMTLRLHTLQSPRNAAGCRPSRTGARCHASDESAGHRRRR